MRKRAGSTSRSRTTARSPRREDESGSTGVGLRNVCDRLNTRYGARAGCLAGPDPDGGYTVHLFIPVIRNG